MSLREDVENKEIALIDILDVVLDKGVAIRGDLLISIAGIDLVYLDLRVLISSVETLIQSSEKGKKELTSDQFDEQRRELLNGTTDASKWKD
ncbi:gas vesicle protein [Priestia koreensis]|uniref:Gas vesicle protein GvpS n=1 Tax=Priestia koreensis TaxID=284581 RepID=A0A0M0KSW3_9BACI|nr:gas vesicle protein [Priestia koreensis]KOO41920.1 gas vesicle protein GvpS [Priestia koreensis]MCM3003558.1 gas vesicle protein [Priestia koreensis]UNL86348.1 gas vesicle protein [Priestia koreensis]